MWARRACPASECCGPPALQEEISEIKAEGNLEAVLDALDRIVEEGKDRTEPAW